VVIRLRPEEGDSSKFSKCVYLSDQDENQLVVEAANRREIFMFDHVAPEHATQLDVYRMIALESVHHAFEVPLPPRRATTAASSPTDRPAPARPSPSWAVCPTSRRTPTVTRGASCRDCWRTCSSRDGSVRRDA
jgi:hypothetical protein